MDSRFRGNDVTKLGNDVKDSEIVKIVRYIFWEKVEGLLYFSVESYRVNSILNFTNVFFTINYFIAMNILSIVLIVVALGAG